MAKGKRILNIDQTPLVDSNLSERAWMASDSKYSKPLHNIDPRITMMLAIDNFGEIYYTLMQANSNDTTMELFLFHLVKLLDQKQSTWRKDYIIMLDGA